MSTTSLVRIQLPPPKIDKLQQKLVDFSFVPQGNNIVCVAHATSFDRRSTSLPLCAAQMNDVALHANDVLHNDVLLRINEVALCANGIATDSLRTEIQLLFNREYDITKTKKAVVS